MNEAGVINLIEAMLAQCYYDIVEKNNKENFDEAVEFMKSDWYEELTGFDGEDQLNKLLNYKKGE